MNDTAINPTARTQIRRLPARGSYDRALIHAILDEGLVCHVGFELEGQPYVIPMVYARHDDRLILHGAPASRMLKAGAAGTAMCATVTLIDGLVFARSAFHHSMNYRSVVVLGVAREVTDPSEKRAALDALVEHLARGRSRETRPPSDKELASTRVLALPITEASAKARTGGPVDDDEDLALPYWAGHVPLRLVAGEPVDDPRAPVRAPVPAWAPSYQRGRTREP